MKNLIPLILIIALATNFVACDDDDNTTPDGPTIGTPALTNAQVGTTVDITFNATVPGGFKSYEVSAVGGTAAKKSEPAAGAKSGNIVVSYTADDNEGAGSVTVTVTDANNKTESETATINKTAIPVPNVVVVSGQIDEDTQWTKNNIYELASRVIVTDGATLTIEAGTIIKGREGQGINATALMVARGGKIQAVGTAEEPIIMTSVLDDIMPGQKAGSNLDENDKGLWGGLVILGKAPISFSGALEAQIEGVPSGEPLGLYGGDDPDDNSGTLKYISIRHGGIEISGGNEINGLTLGGVGKGTQISDIEVFANFDDGVEFFGGTVDVSNILVSHQGDDGVDIDQAYSGTVDGFMVVHAGDTDKGLEIDGPEGAANADGKFVLKNGTIKGSGNVGNPADFKSKAQGTLENIVFQGYDASQKILIASSYDGSCVVTSNAFKNLTDGLLTFTKVKTGGYAVDVYPSSGSCDTTTDDATAAGLVVNDDTATGAPAGDTWNWTISSERELIP
jgi:hypothetical protein